MTGKSCQGFIKGSIKRKLIQNFLIFKHEQTIYVYLFMYIYTFIYNKYIYIYIYIY